MGVLYKIPGQWMQWLTCGLVWVHVSIAKLLICMGKTRYLVMGRMSVAYVNADNGQCVYSLGKAILYYHVMESGSYLY